MFSILSLGLFLSSGGWVSSPAFGVLAANESLTITPLGLNSSAGIETTGIATQTAISSNDSAIPTSAFTSNVISPSISAISSSAGGTSSAINGTSTSTSTPSPSQNTTSNGNSTAYSPPFSIHPHPIQQSTFPKTGQKRTKERERCYKGGVWTIKST